MERLIPLIISSIVIIVGTFIIFKNKKITETLMKHNPTKIEKKSLITFERIMVYIGGIFFVVIGIIAIIGNINKLLTIY